MGVVGREVVKRWSAAGLLGQLGHVDITHDCCDCGEACQEQGLRWVSTGFGDARAAGAARCGHQHRLRDDEQETPTQSMGTQVHGALLGGRQPPAPPGPNPTVTHAIRHLCQGELYM